MISVTNSIYTYHAILENNGVWTGPKTIRELTPPREIKFILDASITQELQHATLRQNVTVSLISFCGSLYIELMNHL